MINPNNPEEVLNFLIQFHQNPIDNEVNREEFINIINNSSMNDAKVCAFTCAVFNNNYILFKKIHQYVSDSLVKACRQTNEYFEELGMYKPSVKDFTEELKQKYPVSYGWTKYHEENKK